MRKLFTCSLTWELRREHGTFGTPINIPYTLLDNTPLHSISSVWRPWGCGCGTIGKAHTTTNSYNDVRGGTDGVPSISV